MSRWLITGSSGHLGEALVRTLRERGQSVCSLDITPSANTDLVASITDRAALTEAMTQVEHVLHTAAMHKPHVGSHTRSAFVESTSAAPSRSSKPPPQRRCAAWCSPRAPARSDAP